MAAFASQEFWKIEASGQVDDSAQGRLFLGSEEAFAGVAEGGNPGNIFLSVDCRALFGKDKRRRPRALTSTWPEASIFQNSCDANAAMRRH